MNTPLPRTSTMAVISLIFGIICWFALPFLGAIIAIVTGHLARGEIARAPAGAIEGGGMALAGMILGWLHLALFVLLIAIAFLFLGGVAFFTHWFH